jgi:DNA-binding transcriptional ArsR family regulator
MKKKQKELEAFADSLKAVGHTERIGILSLLIERNTKLSVTQIGDGLKLNQPKASRHLGILKNKGVLLFERVGANVYYSINKNNALCDCLEKMLKNKK